MAKLVEILARELKEWPEGWPAVGQAVDGDLHREPFTGLHMDCGLSMGEDYMSAVVTHADWQAAVEALNKSAEPAWNGEGRPPIGVEIEFSYPMWGYWLKGKVLCYGEQMIFMEQESSKGNGKFEGSMNPDGIMFRPIRTPEQIAADERLHKVRNAATAIARTLDSLHESEELIAVTVIEAMIDAGYVKQVGS